MKNHIRGKEKKIFFFASEASKPHTSDVIGITSPTLVMYHS